MKKYIIIVLVNFITLYSFASSLEIKNVQFVHKTAMKEAPYILCDVTWKNAWFNDKNHDAIWVFPKYSSFYWAHPKISPQGMRIIENRSNTSIAPKLIPAKDSLGFFIQFDQNYRGDVDIRIRFELDTSTQEVKWDRTQDMKVFGVELVYIPSGSFYLGDESSYAKQYAAFYKSDKKGEPSGPFEIQSENEIQVDSTEGKLYYWSENEIYNGDQRGPVPSSFPKGHDAFYIMKYELNQGQYVDFLNNIYPDWTYLRSPTGGINYRKKKGTIYLDEKQGEFVAENRERPMNYVSFTDGLAYTDWACLRPITELEFTKAARGPKMPGNNEYVWGTDNFERLERLVDRNGDVILAGGLDESQLNDQNRDRFGASYYWVMDLSGSVWEKVITIGNPIGRSFEGSHGDGRLRYGKATNPDWPSSDDEIGGFGYRGGGYYEIGMSYGEFNPHSPIAFRYYGSWSGGPRKIAYGYRAGRSGDSIKK